VPPVFIDPMNGQITLTLLELRFFAYHGWYAQESLKGQSFQVDLWVTYPEPPAQVELLSDTIDYTTVYDLLRKQMDRPRRLLEELAQSILSEIREKFPQVTELTIHIEKVSPPVAGLDGKLGIQLKRTY